MDYFVSNIKKLQSLHVSYKYPGRAAKIRPLVLLKLYRPVRMVSSSQ
jgi:hypothetical protein